MRPDVRTRPSLRFLTLAPAGLLAFAATCPPVRPSPSPNYKTANRLVFPVVPAGPATIDGNAADAAWSSGFSFVMEDGSPFPAARLRGVADASFIYLHAKVDDSNFNEQDVLVIGLNPDNAAANYRRIHIFPCKPTGVCAATGNDQNPTVDYVTGSYPSGTFVPAGASVAGSTVGIDAATRTFTDPANASIKSWEVEVKIPRGAPFNFVATNFFGLFVDIARTDPGAGIAGEAVQYTWPPSQFIGSMNENDILSQLETGTLAPASWGNATLHTGFGNGVSITTDDIMTNHPTDPGKIRINAPNVFYATAVNNTSSGGVLVAANGVAATFKIANNGLPALGSFANVPVSGNPTGAASIPAAAAHQFQTDTWNLTPQQQIDYKNHPSQCIRVELTSSSPSTVFVNTSAMRNMQFVESSSPFRERALVPTRGFEPRPGQRELEFTLRETFINFDPRLQWSTTIKNATRMNERQYVYRAAAARGADHELEILVEPPRMKIPSQAVKIPPGTGGQQPPVRVDVRAGEVVTLIASGTLVIDGQEVSAAGAPMQGRRGEPRLKGQGPRRIGAVIGSFDGFKESAFVVGNASTIKVPEGASVLHLKVNDDAERVGTHKGNGYEFQVVRTPVESWMLTANPGLGRPVRGDDVHVALGSNLPVWLMRGERDTGRVIRIDKTTFRVFESVGTFGYIVKLIK